MEPFSPFPSKRQIEWYHREKTAFFHFGINTFTGNEWGEGTDSPELFCPDRLDCRQWIRTIRAAGFRAAILTAKHHDGFCLWPSAYTDYSVKNSPYRDGKGDIVKEFTDACREYGIKAGIYLSPWDRHEKSYGSARYDDYYAGQLEELMTGYGKIYECWWDGAGSTEAKYDWARWAYIVRNLQPDCVIFGSLGATDFVETRWIGNEHGAAAGDCFAAIDPKALREENTGELNTGRPDGARFLPAEADMSIRPGWFWHEEQNAQVKTPGELFRYWFTSVGSNAGMLLNLPPNRHGLLERQDIVSLLESERLERATFSYSFAAGAEVSADTGEGADRILSDDETFFAAAETEAVLSLKLLREEWFDCLLLSEKIEYGQRITDFSVEAFCGGKWVSVLEGKSVGYKRAAYFDRVSTDLLRIRLRGSAAPVLRFFGIYRLPAGCFRTESAVRENVNLVRQMTAKDTEIDLMLGGTFPFNTVRFGGEGVRSYEIRLFNGTRYETVFSGSAPEREQTVFLGRRDGVYRLRITATEGAFEQPWGEVLYRSAPDEGDV